MIRKCLLLGTLFGLLVWLGAIPTLAATEEDIQDAINGGIAWMVAQQEMSTGRFVGEFSELAETSFAVLKLLDRAYELGMDPFQEDTTAPDYYMYHENVVKGLEYMFSMAGSYGLPGSGITFSMSNHETYNTGIAMMAIAASRTPDRVVVSVNPTVNGLTYLEVVQGCVDYFVFAQNPDGAWRYWYLFDPSDNSNTGFATLGLRYAEEFGAVIPQAVKDNLSPWLDDIQDDVNGDANDGGSWYVAFSWDWINLLKTGNLLFEFAFVGDTVGVTRVDDAVDYIERHWNDPNPDPGWRVDPLAMYCLMKGFVAQNIEEIDVGGPVDWFNEIADAILATKIGSYPGGPYHWDWGYWSGPLLSTELNLLTLEKIAPPPPQIEVAVDIKPTSCRNPFNLGGKGVVPVAILGTADFDVSQIDPATVMLEGVAPLRWAMEDVATPFEPFTGRVDAYDCTTEGADGFLDLTLKFSAQELAGALAGAQDGDVLVLQLHGNLLEEFGGTEIVGEDVVVILSK